AYVTGNLPRIRGIMANTPAPTIIVTFNAVACNSLKWRCKPSVGVVLALVSIGGIVKIPRGLVGLAHGSGSSAAVKPTRQTGLSLANFLSCGHICIVG